MSMMESKNVDGRVVWDLSRSEGSQSSINRSKLPLPYLF